MDSLKISICIVGYNTKKFIKDCLNSIYANLKEGTFEVIVADNNSRDGSVDMIRSEYPKVKLIANKDNGGFAKANNMAMKESRGEYVLLLNPDTVLIDDSLYQLVDFMDQHPEAGSCGPMILNFDKTMQRQCKRGIPNFWNSFTYSTGLWRKFPGNPWWRKTMGGYFLLGKSDDSAAEVDILSGAVMMVRRNILDKVGLMSEDYFLYAEDMDWCMRIKKSGWKNYYVPAAKIIHYGGAGSQIHAIRNLWFFHRAQCIFYSRHVSRPFYFFIDIFYYLGVWTIFCYKLFLNIFKKEKIIGSKKPIS
ncbi:MAG: glycosyltransferase family 2 protein [Candidatus Paceibacterota bacterium]|jgi:hypothetical protein